jgi:ribonuclease HI
MAPKIQKINSLSILQWNSRSAVSNRDDIIFLLKKHHVDVAGISESWFSTDTVVSFPGYVCLRDDRPDGRGGAALLIKKNLHFSPLKIPPSPGSQVVAAEILGIVIFSVYSAPRTSFNSDYWTRVVSNLSSSYILLADFNAHSPSWGSHFTDPAGRAILEFVDDQNLVVLNDGQPTRLSLPNQNPSAVDVSLCSAVLASSLSWEISSDPYSSDHFPIHLSIRNNRIQLHKSELRIGYKTKNADWSLFKDLLSSCSVAKRCIDCVEVLVDTFANDLSKSVIEAADASIPKQKTGVRKKSSPPWWDEECTNMVKLRSDSIKKYKRYASQENFLSFRKIQAQTKKLLRKKKRRGWQDYCTSISPDTPISEVWSSIKKFRGSLSPKPNPNKCSDWVDSFVERLAPPYVPNESETVQVSSASQRENSFLSSKFSLDELVHAIQSSGDSSPGPDKIPYSFFRHFPPPFLLQLLKLFNQILECGSVPDTWKRQIIIPILKSGKDPSLGQSYRPIALSCCFLKILEKMIKARLEWFLETNNLLPQGQLGFRKGKSCLDNLSILITDAHIAKSKKEVMVACFMDVSSAYDNVLLPVLFNKMVSLGVPDSICRLISNILCERLLLIETPVETIQRTVCRGLPQGSSLSPILFNIYTQDLHFRIPPYCSLLQYADDFVVYCKDKLMSRAVNGMENALDLIQPWFSEAGLSLSPSKSQVVIFSNKHKIPDASIKCNKVLIPIRDSLKFLGMTIHRKLNWNMHIEETIQKCEKSINVLRAVSRVWWGAHPSSMRTMYCALVRSHLDYGSFLMDPLPKYLSSKLERVQSKCLRLILGAMRSSPLVALQAECVERPLALRRKFLGFKFLLKRGLSDHPITPGLHVLLGSCRSNSYWHSKVPPLLCSIFESICNEFSDSLASSLPMFSVPFEATVYSPNIVESIDINKSFASLPPHVVNTLFNQKVDENWSSFVRVFTDGSKASGGECGAAFCIPSLDINRMFQLPQKASVFTAECVALREALLEALSKSFPRTVIFSDSLSLVNCLNSNSKSSLSSHVLSDIKSSLHLAFVRRLTVMIVWIPSHIGISGNERADALAKDACTCGVLPHSLVLPITDCMNAVEHSIREEWNEFFQSSATGGHYRAVQSNIPHSPWFQICKIPKLNVSLIVRLRLGHVVLSSHLARIGIVGDATCECGREDETIDHVFFNCPLLPNHDFIKEISKICLTFPIKIQSLLALNDFKINQIIVNHLKKYNKKV